MSTTSSPSGRRPKCLLAKTGLDGHWRGVRVVARALRDAGFEVILLGMVRSEEIVAAVLDEDPDILGLNVGGRIEIVERILDELREALGEDELPIMVGGTIPPWAVERLESRGVACFPPGSALSAITDRANDLIGVS